jgi:hypothetical protein
MVGPSGSGRAVGGAAAGGRGEDGGVASWPGAVLGVVDTVSCSGDRGGCDADLAVQGLVFSEGAVAFGFYAAAGVTDDLFPAAADPASTLIRARMPGGRTVCGRPPSAGGDVLLVRR